MRDHDSLPTIDSTELAGVTGGCKKKAVAAAAFMQAPCDCGSEVDVQVATGVPAGGASAATQLV